MLKMLDKINCFDVTVHFSLSAWTISKIRTKTKIQDQEPKLRTKTKNQNQEPKARTKSKNQNQEPKPKTKNRKEEPKSKSPSVLIEM